MALSLSQAMRRLAEVKEAAAERERRPSEGDAESIPASPTESKPDIELDDAQMAVVKGILESSNDACLAAPAGTGKSVITSHLQWVTSIALCATTGRAGLNIGAPTLDAVFSYDRNKNATRNKDWLDFTMRRLPTLIAIDEASMVGRNMANYVHTVARAYGKRILLIGDFAQAAPVKDDWGVTSPLFLNADFFRLSKIYRQSDAEYLEALSHIRVGEVTDSVRRTLGRCMVAGPPLDDAYIRLTATNSLAKHYNATRLSQLPTKPVVLTAEFIDIRQNASSPHPGFVIQRALENSRMAHNAEFKIGARVVITMNDNPLRRWVNGDTGTLVDVRMPGGVGLDEFEFRPYNPWGNEPPQDTTPESLVIELDRGSVVKMEKSRQSVDDPFGNPDFAVSGFPVLLGWAITIHRAQGITVDKAYVDIASICAMPGESRHGLAYVALSRTRTLDGLMIGSWDDAAVYCSPAVRDFIA